MGWYGLCYDNDSDGDDAIHNLFVQAALTMSDAKLIPMACLVSPSNKTNLRNASKDMEKSKWDMSILSPPVHAWVFQCF